MTLIRMAHMHSNVNCSRRWLVAAIFYENQRREGYKYIRASTRIAYIYVYYPIVPGNIIGVSYRPSEGFKIWTSHPTMTIDLYRNSHEIVTTPGETVKQSSVHLCLCPPFPLSHIIPVTLSIMAISLLKRFMMRPNGVTWKKCNDFSIMDCRSLSCKLRRALQPAHWPAGVDIMAMTMHTQDIIA